MQCMTHLSVTVFTEFFKYQVAPYSRVPHFYDVYFIYYCVFDVSLCLLSQMYTYYTVIYILSFFKGFFLITFSTHKQSLQLEVAAAVIISIHCMTQSILADVFK